MDIYGARKHLEALQEYVNSLTEKDSKMYQTTKNRLKELSLMCQNIVTTISNILQEELLESDEEEFENKENLDVLRSLEAMEQELARLKSFVGPAAIPSESQTLTGKEKHNIIATYGDGLRSLSSTPTEYSSAAKCAKLLYTWFQCRFLKPNPEFHYNIRNIKGWIRDIIIVYGNHIQSYSEDQFYDEFLRWCDAVNTGQTTYAIPYEVFQCSRGSPGQKVSLASLVLWDILFDMGLKNLCTASPNDAYLLEDSIYEKCYTTCPEVTDEYEHYKTHPDILSRTNIYRGGGKE